MGFKINRIPRGCDAVKRCWTYPPALRAKIPSLLLPKDRAITPATPPQLSIRAPSH